MVVRHSRNFLSFAFIGVTLAGMMVGAIYGEDVQPIYVLLGSGGGLVIWVTLAFALKLGEAVLGAGIFAVFSASAASYGAFLLALAGVVGALLLVQIAFTEISRKT